MNRIAILLGFVLLPWALAAAERETDQLRARAYELSAQKRYEQAADFFQRYLEKNPADTQATIDYAGLLSQLNRHAQAAQVWRVRRVVRHKAARAATV